MRSIFPMSLIAVLAALSITACSSSTASSSADSTASSSAAADSSATSDNSATSSATSDNTAASAAPANNMAAASGAPPLYPGAAAGTAPAGLGEKALPKTVKVYSTSDGFAKVKTWYQGKLKGAQEMAQPGKEKTMDAFLLGQGKSATVVMIQSLNGKTWIAIGPAM